jgi:GNAT superfamily N-acetyltransferase
LRASLYLCSPAHGLYTGVMPADDIRIHPLQSADAARYNAFFGEGARAHPETLRITPGDISATPFSTAETDHAVTLAAVDSSGRWLGAVSVEREPGREKRRHVAWLLRMYVPQASAGRGIGRILLRAGIERARGMPGIAKLNLTVAASNERAIRLYESEGFREFSREADAFRNGTQSVEELSMSRVLER